MKTLIITISLLGMLGFATLGAAQDTQSKHSHREHKGLPGGHQPAESDQSGTYQGTHDHRKHKGLPGKGLPSDQTEPESVKTSTAESVDPSAGSVGTVKHDHRKQKGLAGSSLPDEGAADEGSVDSSPRKVHDHKKMHK